MINLADLDESTPYLGQLKETSGPVTIINTFVAPEGKADEVLAAWADDAAFTNIALWESTEDLLAAFGTPEFARHMERYPDGTVAYPHMYQKAAVEGICVA